MKHMTWAIAAAMTVAAGAHIVRAQGATQASPQMSFFITSVGSGNGANLGGLAGADAHCQKLAKAVGAGNKQWRAYLSTQGPGARERQGPHRHRAVVQLQGRPDRGQRRRPALATRTT